jgi:hypothetical protein
MSWSFRTSWSAEAFKSIGGLSNVSSMLFRLLTSCWVLKIRCTNVLNYRKVLQIYMLTSSSWIVKLNVKCFHVPLGILRGNKWEMGMGWYDLQSTTDMYMKLDRPPRNGAIFCHIHNRQIFCCQVLSISHFCNITLRRTKISRKSRNV